MAETIKKSNDGFTDLYENPQEISINGGINLITGPNSFLNEPLLTTAGTLSLVRYQINNLFIEWKRNDCCLIAGATMQEQDDQSFVDTIAKHEQTASECITFNNTTGTVVQKGNTGERQQQSPQSKSNILRARICDFKRIDVLKNRRIIRLINKSDGKVHSEYFFQNGNADGFVRTLQTTHCLQRSRNNKNQFEIVDNVEYDNEKSQKTFAELKIEDIKGRKSDRFLHFLQNLFKTKSLIKPSVKHEIILEAGQNNVISKTFAELKVVRNIGEMFDRLPAIILNTIPHVIDFLVKAFDKLFSGLTKGRDGQKLLLYVIDNLATDYRSLPICNAIFEILSLCFRLYFNRSKSIWEILRFCFDIGRWLIQILKENEQFAAIYEKISCQPILNKNLFSMQDGEETFRLVRY